MRFGGKGDEGDRKGNRGGGGVSRGTWKLGLQVTLLLTARGGVLDPPPHPVGFGQMGDKDLHLAALVQPHFKCLFV